jgi:hypothetical protein
VNEQLIKPSSDAQRQLLLTNLLLLFVTTQRYVIFVVDAHESNSLLYNGFVLLGNYMSYAMSNCVKVEKAIRLATK